MHKTDLISEKNKQNKCFISFLIDCAINLSKGIFKLALLLFQTLINNHNPHANFVIFFFLTLLHHMQCSVEQEKYIYIIVLCMRPEKNYL